MPIGISLHIRLNQVDKNSEEYSLYTIPDLIACENDARDMCAIATKSGYFSSMLLGRAATKTAVTNAIVGAAVRLREGDIFLLTYSGHGSQLIDTSGDEADGLDETWVLYDRQIIDDELYELWGKFAPGVRIVVISDSCHSGTVTRFSGTGSVEKPNTVSKGLAEKAIAPVRAAGILISGCQDKQVSWDGLKNGLFTSRLLEVWAGGKFAGSYKQFRNAIALKLPRSQSPNYFLFGARSTKFSRQKPFSI